MFLESCDPSVLAASLTNCYLRTEIEGCPTRRKSKATSRKAYQDRMSLSFLVGGRAGDWVSLPWCFAHRNLEPTEPGSPVCWVQGSSRLFILPTVAEGLEHSLLTQSPFLFVFRPKANKKRKTRYVFLRRWATSEAHLWQPCFVWIRISPLSFEGVLGQEHRTFTLRRYVSCCLLQEPLLSRQI